MALAGTPSPGVPDGITGYKRAYCDGNKVILDHPLGDTTGTMLLPLLAADADVDAEAFPTAANADVDAEDQAEVVAVGPTGVLGVPALTPEVTPAVTAGVTRTKVGTPAVVLRYVVSLSA